MPSRGGPRKPIRRGASASAAARVAMRSLASLRPSYAAVDVARRREREPGASFDRQAAAPHDAIRIERQLDRARSRRRLRERVERLGPLDDRVLRIRRLRHVRRDNHVPRAPHRLDEQPIVFRIGGRHVEHDVEDDRPRAAARQRIDQRAVHPPRPRPRTLQLAERRLVDRDDHDVVWRRRFARRDAHEAIVDGPVEPLRLIRQRERHPDRRRHAR